MSSTPWRNPFNKEPERDTMAATVTPIKPEVHSQDDKTITVPIPIRSDMTVSITIPKDLKAKEAARIGRVMEALAEDPPGPPHLVQKNPVT